MTYVKEILPEQLTGVLRRMREELDTEAAYGLRVSQLRMLHAIPPGGASVTDLAERVGMTKQGCGQFVTTLRSTGHVRTVAHPADARVRLVVLTDEGAEVLDRALDTIDALEQRWAGLVGPRRWSTFRSVLHELAEASDDGAPGRDG